MNSWRQFSQKPKLFQKLDLRKRIEQAYYKAIGAESRWEGAQKLEVASKEVYRFAQKTTTIDKTYPIQSFSSIEFEAVAKDSYTQT